MPVKVNIHTAKTHLSRLIQRVNAGEEIIISKSGKPMAKLIPFQPLLKERVSGLFKNQVRISEDFDSALPEWPA